MAHETGSGGAGPETAAGKKIKQGAGEVAQSAGGLIEKAGDMAGDLFIPMLTEMAEAPVKTMTPAMSAEGSSGGSHAKPA